MKAASRLCAHAALCDLFGDSRGDSREGNHPDGVVALLLVANLKHEIRGEEPDGRSCVAARTSISQEPRVEFKQFEHGDMSEEIGNRTLQRWASRRGKGHGAGS